jgi:hypothetical protein
MLAFLAGDFDLNGTVERDDYDLWKASFGIIGESPVDGNGNGVVDAADYTVWRDNLGKTLAGLPPIAPRNIDARAVGATSIQVDWQASVGATSYLVARRQPDTETFFSVIASNVIGTSFTDNAVVENSLYEYALVAKNTNGDSGPSQIGHAVAGRSNLTAYRPQSVQDPDAPTGGPIYDPFVRTPVRDQDENDTNFGPGIRLNTDDDNNTGIQDRFESGIASPLENDLIEVKVDRLPGQGNLILDPSGQLSLYYDHTKETPVPVDMNGNSEPLPFINDTITVFVEWNDIVHGASLLVLRDAATSTSLDVVRFHSFRSLVVVFGGNGQDPTDTDGDGSIGDPVRGSAINREGIFDTAQILYVTGWDVLAFDEEDVDHPDDVPYREINNAILNRSVRSEFAGGVSIMGYSQGGGATHDLIERLYADYQDLDHITMFGVYLDAVQHDFPLGASERRWPEAVFYLLNIYQSLPLQLGGGDIDNNDVIPGAILEEIDTTTDPGWNANLDHFLIDDDIQVRNRILQRLHERMLR